MTTVTTATIINELDSKGYLNLLLKMGIVSPKILFYQTIHTRYQQAISKGKTKTEAKQESAEFFKVDERTIFNALKFMDFEVTGKE